MNANVLVEFTWKCPQCERLSRVGYMAPAGKLWMGVIDPAPELPLGWRLLDDVLFCHECAPKPAPAKAKTVRLPRAA